MNSQDISRCINRYFKQPSVDRDNLYRLLSYVDQHSRQNMQRQMIRKLFTIAENNMNKENLKVTIKRYLHLINQILQKDQKSYPQNKYKEYISAEIVPQFILMLRNVFNHGPMELFPQMKLYRKRWAKRISDHSYNMLQNQSLRQLKLDLDKGFSDQNVKKLTKSYIKRQFTQSQIEKYLPATNNQTGSETRKNSAVSSSGSQMEDRQQKKIKRQMFDGPKERVAQYGNQIKSDMVSRHSSSIPSHLISIVNGSAVDPRRPFQIPPYRPPPISNIYPPNNFQLNYRVTNPSIGQNIAYMGPAQPFYPNNNMPSTYSYMSSHNSYPNSYANYPNPSIDPRQETRYQVPNSKLTKLMQKMENCKFCGLMISTNEKYEEHMYGHFTQAQKLYEVSHSRTDHSRKANKSLLPCLQEWIDSNRKKMTDQKFLIPIQGEVNRNEICFICKSELTISWSDEIDSWVYEDAIRTKTRSNSLSGSSMPYSNKNSIYSSICHAQCYHTIDEFDRSIDSPAQ